MCLAWRPQPWSRFKSDSGQYSLQLDQVFRLRPDFIIPPKLAAHSTRGYSPTPRLPEVFSTEVYNSPASNPNRRSHSASADERQDIRSRRRLALGNGDSPDHSIDESSRARSARDGGADERNRVDDGSDEDDSDAQLNTETFVNTLSASNQPVLQQLSAHLKDKDKQVTGLERKLKASEERAST